MKPQTTKKDQYKDVAEKLAQLEDRHKALWTNYRIMIGAIIAITLLAVIVPQIMAHQRADSTISVPVTNAGVFYQTNGRTAVAVFDMQDPNQKELARQLAMIFKGIALDKNKKQ